MFQSIENALSKPIFCNHGIPVQADEGRTAAICTNEQGDTRLVIAARGYVLIVDPKTYTSRQVYFPNNNRDYPYASVGSERGLFYIGAGRQWMVLNPFIGKFIDCSQPGLPDEAFGFSLAEGADGAIYVASYPTCRLLKYMPDICEWTELGILDAKEDYPFTLAVGQDGWIYAGIGTERCIVAARDPKNGEMRQLIASEETVSGRGLVFLGVDGEVYGQLMPAVGDTSQSWYRLQRGEATLVAAEEVPDSEYSNTGFDTVHKQFPAPWRLLHCSLQDKEVIVLDESAGQTHTIPLVYSSLGADLSPIIAGPDNRIYGTSNHPLHLYSYDPQSNVLEDLGGKWIEKGGGGNICAYAVQGNLLVGAAYAGGHIHLIDTSHPFEREETGRRNPRLIASIAEIYRPRCALAHPDGKHVIFGGYGDYGIVGGGLYIRNLADGAELLLPPEQLVPYHSTLCMVPLPGGDLLCGTSIEAPGGGKPRDTEGRLYRLNWQTKEVVYSEAPIRGAQAIDLMEIGLDGLVHAFTETMYFVYEPDTRNIVHQQDISSWGRVVRQGLVKDGDGMIYGVREQAIFRIDVEARHLTLLARPPETITAGLALLGGRMYYAAGESLWSMQL